MIDSHCHLDFTIFDQDRSDILASCVEKGVDGIVIPGTQASQWQNQLALCHSFPQLHCALGLHPYFLNQHQSSDFDLLASLVNQYRADIVAIGEVGLDFAISLTPNGPSQSLQLRVFETQMGIAKDFGLPMILHHRKSHQELIKSLKKADFNNSGVVHAFSGSLQEAKAYIDLGFKIGVGGSITYPRAVKTRNTVSNIPLDSIVIETDAPDMPMFGRQGQRNQPDYLPQVLKTLSELRQTSECEVEQQTSLNAIALFGLSTA